MAGLITQKSDWVNQRLRMEAVMLVFLHQGLKVARLECQLLLHWLLLLLQSRFLVVVFLFRSERLHLR
jgi:hypothetical protein